MLKSACEVMGCVSRLCSPRKKRAGCSFLSEENNTVGGTLLYPHTRIVADTKRKMAALLVLLFSVGALFFSSNAQQAYKNLPESYKKGVDLALEKLNSHDGLQHHFLFLRSIIKSDIEVMYSKSALYSQCLSFVVLWLIEWFSV